MNEPSIAEKVATIISAAELEGFRAQLAADGRLDTEAMRAIRDRQDYLRSRGLK